MTKLSRQQHSREWASLVAAIALGPVFLIVGYRIPGFVFGAAAWGLILLCAVFVPLLTLAAGRFRFLVWQVAVISLTFTILQDNFRLSEIRSSQIVSAAYVFWALGTLVSSPLPIYFLLKALAPRQRYIVGMAIAMAALGLWVGIKKITG